MNVILRDKCFARRMVRAGCVEAVGIVRARRMDSTRVPTNAERVSAWRGRSHAPGFGGYYVRPWKAKREPIADCPQPDGREIDPRDVIQSMPARAATAHDSPPVATIRAGSFPQDKRALPDMTPEQWEEWEAAFGPEPNIPEDC